MILIRLLIALLLCGTLRAHVVLEAQLTMRIEGGRLTGTAESDPAYLLSEFRPNDVPEPRNLAWLRALGAPDRQAIEAEVDRYWHARLILEADGVVIPWTLTVRDFHTPTPRYLGEGNPNDLPDLGSEIQAPLPPGTHRVEAVWNDPLAMVLMLSIGSGDDERLQPVLSGGRALVAERPAAAPELKVAEPTPGRWVALGYEHILPKGLDHILFVLGLFLLVPKWKPLLQQTLVFTLAHSLSLAAASLGWVNLPSKLVEVAIAASIAWVGVENLTVKSLHKGRLALVGIFGLIHGLGFASALAELLPANHPEKLPVALFGFNLGVELGQITVLLIAFACFGWLGKRFKVVKQVGSVIVAVVGLILVAQRITGVSLIPFL